MPRQPRMRRLRTLRCRSRDCIMLHGQCRPADAPRRRLESNDACGFRSGALARRPLIDVARPVDNALPVHLRIGFRKATHTPPIKYSLKRNIIYNETAAKVKHARAAPQIVPEAMHKRHATKSECP